MSTHNVCVPREILNINNSLVRTSVLSRLMCCAMQTGNLVALQILKARIRIFYC